MKAPTRFFLVCLGLAALAVAGSYLYSMHLDSRLTAATAACEAESKRLVEETEAKTKLQKKEVPAADLTPEQALAIKNAKARMAQAEGKKTYTIDEVMSGASTPGNEKGPWNDYRPEQSKNPFDQFDRDEFGGYVCEPLALATAGYDLESLSKVQQELVAAYWSAQSSDPIRFGLVWVSALLLLGILPHAWYFLLRRLREVAASIRGE